jgi:hypothetical protein
MVYNEMADVNSPNMILSTGDLGIGPAHQKEIAFDEWIQYQPDEQGIFQMGSTTSES